MVISGLVFGEMEKGRALVPALISTSGLMEAVLSTGESGILWSRDALQDGKGLGCVLQNRTGKTTQLACF